LEVLLAEAAKAGQIAAGYPDPAAATGATAPAALAGADALAKQQQAFGAALFDAGRDHEVLALAKGEAGKDRLAIYRGNLSASWEKSLAAAYPVVRQMVGEAFFGGLARAYGKAFPSQDPDLNQYGRAFARFLGAFAPAADHPYLPALAELEWLLHRAYYAPDAPMLAADELGTIAPDKLDNARFALHPAVALHASEWASVQLWLAHQDGDAPFPEEVRAASRALVARPGWHGVAVAVPEAAYAALEVLRDGGRFGAALDAAFAVDEGFDLGANLQQWLALGVLSRLVL
jgi:hypothetical protein